MGLEDLLEDNIKNREDSKKKVETGGVTSKGGGLSRSLDSVEVREDNSPINVKECVHCEEGIAVPILRLKSDYGSVWKCNRIFCANSIWQCEYLLDASFEKMLSLQKKMNMKAKEFRTDGDGFSRSLSNF